MALAINPNWPQIEDAINRGALEDALRIAVDSVNVAMAADGQEAVSYALALDPLGYVYTITAAFEQAIATHEEAARIIEGHFGRTSKEYAQVLCRLPYNYFRTGQIGKAAAVASDAVRIIEHLGELDGQCYAEALSKESMIRAFRGDLGAAESLCVRALRLSAELVGKGSRNFCGELWHLAIIYIRKQQWYAAKRSLERVLWLHGQAQWIDEYMCAMASRELGRVLEHFGDVKAARDLYSQALSILCRVRGENHADTRSARELLANLK